MKPKTIELIVRIVLVLLVIGACVTIAVNGEELSPIRTERQGVLHEAADILRAYGYADDSPAIKALKEAWIAEQEALDIVARVIYGEAGGCTFEHQVCVGAVVRNRVESEYFPDTYREVVAQPGQYTELYLTGFDKTSREAYEAAKLVLDGEDDVPRDVIWQAEFPQGREVWKIFNVDTGWYKSTTYFCRGVYGGFGGAGYGG